MENLIKNKLEELGINPGRNSYTLNIKTLCELIGSVNKSKESVSINEGCQVYLNGNVILDLRGDGFADKVDSIEVRRLAYSSSSDIHISAYDSKGKVLYSLNYYNLDVDSVRDSIQYVVDSNNLSIKVY